MSFCHRGDCCWSVVVVSLLFIFFTPGPFNSSIVVVVVFTYFFFGTFPCLVNVTVPVHGTLFPSVAAGVASSEDTAVGWLMGVTGRIRDEGCFLTWKSFLLAINDCFFNHSFFAFNAFSSGQLMILSQSSFPS